MARPARATLIIGYLLASIQLASASPIYCDVFASPPIVSELGRPGRQFAALTDVVESRRAAAPTAASFAEALSRTWESLSDCEHAPDELAALRISVDASAGQLKLVRHEESRTFGLDGARPASLAKRLAQFATKGASELFSQLVWHVLVESYLLALDEPWTGYVYADELEGRRALSHGRSFAVGFHSAWREGGLEITAVTDPELETAGLEAGARVLALDGRELDELTPRRLRRYWLEERPFDYTVRVVDDGGESEFSGRARPLKHPTLSWTLEDGTGFVHLHRFSRSTLTEWRRARRRMRARGLERLVFDLRGNGGGTTAVGFVDCFLRPGRTVASYRDSSSGEEVDVDATLEFHPEPIVLIVNGDTASMAELFTAAIRRAGRGVIIGERTLGKGVGQEELPVGEEGRVFLVHRTYFHPGSRESWDGEGLDPDIALAAEYSVPLPLPDLGRLRSEDAAIERAVTELLADEDEGGTE